jgi:hypothetical protein
MKRFVLLIGILLILRLPAFASITFDAAATTSASSTNSFSWSHTTASQSNRVLFVLCRLASSSSATTITGITYNSVALTKITSAGTSTPDDNVRVEAWKLVAPTTGTNTVAVTLDTSSGSFRCGSETWYGVDQTTTNRTAVTATSGTDLHPTASTVDATSVSGDIVLDVIGWRYDGQGTVTIGGGQTERFVTDSTLVDGSSESASGVSTTMSWSWVNADWTSSSQIAFAVIPVAASSIAPMTLLIERKRR